MADLDLGAELSARRATLQGTMTFLAAAASGMEEAIGDPARTVTRLAGQQLGRKLAAGAAPTTDVLAALDVVRTVLTDHGCAWHFEPFRRAAQVELVQSTERGQEVLLVFRECMIRQSLFCFGHAQKGALCTLMTGFFDGALRTVMGRSAHLEIVHAGENACLKRLILLTEQTVGDGAPAVADGGVQ